MKINRKGENLLDRPSLLHFCLAQLMHIVNYLIVHELLWYFKQNLCDGSLPNPTGPLPVLQNRPSYEHTANSKLNSIKNPRDMHVHKSLSNVAIHMLCINMYCAGRYQLEMVFTHAHLPLIAMGNTLYRSDCI